MCVIVHLLIQCEKRHLTYNHITFATILTYVTQYWQGKKSPNSKITEANSLRKVFHLFIKCHSIEKCNCTYTRMHTAPTESFHPAFGPFHVLTLNHSGSHSVFVFFFVCFFFKSLNIQVKKYQINHTNYCISIRLPRHTKIIPGCCKSFVLSRMKWNDDHVCWIMAVK